MISIFAPAVQVMNRLKYAGKFVLVGILLLIPTIVVMSQYIRSVNNTMQFSEDELYGLEYNAPVLQLLESIQNHGMYAHLVLSGNIDYEDELSATQAQIETQIAAIDAVDARLGDYLQVSDDWGALKSFWATLIETLPTLNAERSDGTHDGVQERVLALLTAVGNNSNLILDPDIDTYYLMDTVITKLPLTTNYLAQIRSEAIRVYTAPQFRSDSQAEVNLLTELANTTITANETGYTYAYAYNPALEARIGDNVERTINRSRAYLNGVWLSNRISTSLDDYLTRMDNIIGEHFDLYQQVQTELATLINVRIAGFETQRNVVLVVAVIAILASVYFFAGFYLAVRKTIDTLSHAADIMVGGQQGQALVLESRDELAEIVTAFNNVAASLVDARDKALQSSRLKDEFLATMSHELRTPLTSIIGYTGILMTGMRGQVDDVAKGMLARVRESSHNLLNLINDILDIAKIEAGRMELVEAPFELREFVQKLQAQADVLARQKEVNFEVVIDEDLPEIIYGDADKMGQVVRNLLSNAVKFTEEGVVRLKVLQKSQNLIFEVSDTGIGIPPQAIDYIFDEFRQVDGTTRRVYGGTGLGLAIVRKLCLTMGGRIQVQSKVNTGSTFTVTLPLHTSATQSAVLIRSGEDA
jgi:signal transduction histidine kinase